MKTGASGRYDKSAVPGARKVRRTTLNITDVERIDRAELHAERLRDRLDRGELSNPGPARRIADHRDARHPWCNFLEELQPLPLRLYSNCVKPVVLPPGRARLST